jgi:hypothetical protein
MDGSLCEFANRFPDFAADILERDRHKRRHFREESITDLLMAGLVGFEHLGIRVDFPDEPTTGADMDWEFVAPKSVAGGRYLRLFLQAKRAIQTKAKSPKWYYKELDHESPKGAGKGSQAKTLVTAAAAETACCPLYLFYHPRSALTAAHGSLPSIEGVNAVLAHPVATAVSAKCTIADKRLERWRPLFMRLEDLLCWPEGALLAPQARAPLATAQFIRTAAYTAQFFPSRLAEQINEVRTRLEIDAPSIKPADRIPPATLRAIRGDLTDEDRARLKRPRAIFYGRTTDDALDTLKV